MVDPAFYLCFLHYNLIIHCHTAIYKAGSFFNTLYMLYLDCQFFVSFSVYDRYETFYKCC